MEENYNRSKLSCIMDFLFSLLLILFVIYAFIYGKLEPWTILLRILLLLISICVPYKKYVKKNINGLLYYIFLVLGAIIEIGFLMNYKISKDDNSLGAVLQFLAWVICIIVVLRILSYVVKNYEDIIKTSVLVFVGIILFFMIGLLDNISITGGVFLLGVTVMFISEDMSMLLQFNSIRKKFDTEKNDKQMAINLFRKKLYINTVFGLSYVAIMIFNKIDAIHIYNYVFRIDKDSKPKFLELVIFKGEFYVLIFLIIAFLVKYIFDEDNKNVIFTELKKDFKLIIDQSKEEVCSPRVIKKMKVGKNIIDKINPEILIENREEIPRDIYVLLEKVSFRQDIRNLIIIYPDRKIYKCEFKVYKNAVTRTTSIDLVKE